MQKNHISKIIYLKSLNTMKKTLDLLGFKMDRRTKDFSYAKSQIMDYFYENLRKIFKEMEDNKILKKCSCGHSLRKGWTDCKCGGSGFLEIDNKSS